MAFHLRSWKKGGPALFTSLHHLIQCIWQSECVPQEWKDGTIIALYKNKCPFTCGNYRGIALLSVAGKVLAKVALNRWKPLIEKLLPET